MEKSVQLIDERELSRITGLSLSTLRNHRHLGLGVPYLKLGKAVRYSLEDLMEYLELHRIRPRQI